MADAPNVQEPGIDIEKRGTVAIVTIRNPARRNAFTRMSGNLRQQIGGMVESAAVLGSAAAGGVPGASVRPRGSPPPTCSLSVQWGTEIRGYKRTADYAPR